MKQIGIIVTDPDDPTAIAFGQACQKNKVGHQIMDLQKAEVSIENRTKWRIGKIDPLQFDAIVVRDVGAGAFEGVSFRFDILRQLEEEGVLVVNSPSAIQNAANKYYASCLLSNKGLPIPKTKVVQDTESAIEVLEEMKDAVIKPVFGYKGMGIHRIKNGMIMPANGTDQTKLVPEQIDQLLEQRGMLYIQEFIENPGRDIRAFVVNGKLIGAIYRTAPEGSWINNLSQGGSVSQCKLSAEQEDICIKAAGSIGAFFAGVDLVEKRDTSNIKVDGSLILEVNGTPSVAGIYKAWGINAADDIIRDVIKEI
ncbi:SSU ribosomal protein S6P modification protein [Methanococcoides vulcani]|uniref:SSU ribosomal protein S6P modification protein n=2 Tax=Methanococcoides vulcani TaxID=1353158 RepID=A0A1H9YAT6_9EURY|nr:tetrahydromethanopterin:alpha-L-glutamate ligase [Methanococcoides vulcani]SES66061.1 SSU ribosomal protein S6P modification protein [Methanococcoides vulcani]